jgi:hypothetical protein
VEARAEQTGGAQRVLCIIALVAAAALGVWLLPNSVRGQTQPGDSGFGSGHVLLTDFVGSGHSGPNNENPVGTLTLRGYLNFTATTTCSNVKGNAVVSGYRIETLHPSRRRPPGERVGRGFLTSSVDNGPPRDGRPVDVTVYSGLLPKPPVNCPSPGDPPPRRFFSTGGGPFTSGDFTVVDSREHLPGGTPAARLVGMDLSLRPRRLAGRPRARLVVRARVCGLPGTALLRFVQTTSPVGRDRPVGVVTRWQDELRQGSGCQTHRVVRRLAGYPGGRRYRLALKARTTGRTWSRIAARVVDAR